MRFFLLVKVPEPFKCNLLKFDYTVLVQKKKFSSLSESGSERADVPGARPGSGQLCSHEAAFDRTRALAR